MCGVMTPLGTQSQSREALLARLEQMTGRALRTHEDVREFVAFVQLRENDAAARSFSLWRTVKRCALLALLGVAVGQYYVIDLMMQLASLRENTFFVPTALEAVRSALAACGYFA
jgi:hypothetical protein